MAGRARVLFLADAGPGVGGGHVMRCLTLARALTHAGADCGFVATPAALAVIEAFATTPLRIFRLGEDADAGEWAKATAQAAQAWPANAIVADHYGLGAKDEAVLAGACERLLIVDDLRRRHSRALVLDSGLGRQASDYPGCEALIGPAFALVRPQFAAAREAALERRGEAGAVKRVLISLGLGDAGGITGRVARALSPMLGEMRADVVIGDAAPSRHALEAMAAEDARLTLHIETRDMAALMAAADVAVGAGGSSAWERCVVGLPSLAVILADNQRENTLALEQAGATIAVAPPSRDFDARLKDAFAKLVGDAALRTTMSVSAAALCDGQGATRATERLLAN